MPNLKLQTAPDGNTAAILMGTVPVISFNSDGTSNAIFPSGTRMLFAQAAAPTGWTQVTDDSANNRMLRVVNTAGGGVAGTHSPILNNVVPAHTHGFSTGNESSNHYHSGQTSTVSADHAHTYTAPHTSFSAPIGPGYGDVARSIGTHYSGGISANHTHSFSTGWTSHSHNHSGTTDNGSSQTNWTPRYIDMIICQKV